MESFGRSVANTRAMDLVPVDVNQVAPAGGAVQDTALMACATRALATERFGINGQGRGAVDRWLAGNAALATVDESVSSARLARMVSVVVCSLHGRPSWAMTGVADVDRRPVGAERSGQLHSGCHRGGGS